MTKSTPYKIDMQNPTEQEAWELGNAPPQAIIEHCAEVAESFNNWQGKEIAAAIRKWSSTNG